MALAAMRKSLSRSGDVQAGGNCRSGAGGDQGTKLVVVDLFDDGLVDLRGFNPQNGSLGRTPSTISGAMNLSRVKIFGRTIAYPTCGLREPP